MAVNIECPNCSEVFKAEDEYISDADDYVCPECHAKVLVDISYDEPEEDEIDAGNGGA